MSRKGPCKCGMNGVMGPHGACLMCGGSPTDESGQVTEEAPATREAVSRTPAKKLEGELAEKISLALKPLLRELTKSWLRVEENSRLLYFNPDDVAVTLTRDGSVRVTFNGRACQSALEELGLKALMGGE